MKRCLSVVLMIILTVTAVGSAGAESIKGRLGVTGRLGFIVPSDQPADAQSGFAGGGGLIFGISDILAAEADVVYASNIEFNNAQGEIRQTDVAVGLQVRNNVADSKLAAYLGAGLDILFINDAVNLMHSQKRITPLETQSGRFGCCRYGIPRKVLQGSPVVVKSAL